MRYTAKLRAFTILELLCVIAIITILAALLLPALSRGTSKAKRIQCMNNLHQMGIAFHMFAQDHNNAFPMASTVTQSRSNDSPKNLQWFNSQFFFGYRPFQALSNELVSPKTLVCPSDERSATNSFSSLQDRNVSYFAGLKADYLKPQSILAGDRNITNDSAGRVTLVQLGPNQPLRWTSGLHEFQGNLLFADSSVQRSKNLGGDSKPIDQPGGIAFPTSQSVSPNSPAGQRVVGRTLSSEGGMSEKKPTGAQPMMIPVGPLAGIRMETLAANQLSTTTTQAPKPQIKAIITTNIVAQPTPPSISSNEPSGPVPDESLGMVTIKTHPSSNLWLLLLLLLLLLLAIAMEEYWRRRVRKERLQKSGSTSS
jgi:prepilin-type N-terminal cleavage/methylation domain-containing protein